MIEIHEESFFQKERLGGDASLEQGHPGQGTENCPTVMVAGPKIQERSYIYPRCTEVAD